MIRDELEPVQGFHVDIGRACNAKCLICYYRFSTWDCKNKTKRDNSLKTEEELKQEIAQACMRKCKYVNFTGGEPTIHPKITELVKFSADRKLEPIMITNCLSPSMKVNELIGVGCRHWLLSIHGYKEKQDEILQVPGAWEKALKHIEILNKRNIYWRVNCTMNKMNYKDLLKLAEFYRDSGVKAVNFIGLNLYYDEWQLNKVDDIQMSYKEIGPYLEDAIDILQAANIWVNVRYFPMCFLRKQYRKHVVNHPQVYFDGGKESREWDYNIMPKTISRYNSYARQIQHGINQQDGECGKCAIRNVCGGVNKHYSKIFGDEVRPQHEKSDYPWYYRRQYTTDIIVPAYRMKADVTRLLNEIAHKTMPPYNLHVINQNQSAAKNRNEGLIGSAEYIIMCDDDVAELPYAWNRKMIEPLITDPKIMTSSARLLNEDGSIGLNSANNINLEDEYVKVNMIPTACCAFRRNDLDGLTFDDRMLGSGWEDTDFFSKLKSLCEEKDKGSTIIINNNVQVVHLNEEKEGFNTPNGRYNKSIFIVNKEREEEKKLNARDDEKTR